MHVQQRVKVSSHYRLTVPRRVREQLGIKSGDHLLVEVRGSVIVLLPEPQDYIEYMAGLHKEIWEEVDAATYVRQEREAWTDSMPS